jgi:hypothetical protein
MAVLQRISETALDTDKPLFQISDGRIELN